MSLSQKIQNVLGVTQHSPEAEHGVVDHRTPGSFPSDEPVTASSDTQRSDHTSQAGHEQIPSSNQSMPGGAALDSGATSTGNHQNKLHKKDDPRGQTTAFAAPLHSTAHDQTSSGAGLTPTRHGQASTGYDQDINRSAVGSGHNFDNNQSYQQNPDNSSTTGAGSLAGGLGLSAAAIGEDRSGTKPANSLADERQDRNINTTTHENLAQRPRDNQSNQHGGQAGAILGGIGATHESHNIVTNGKNKNPIDHEDPYWGNLPQGTGVQGTGAQGTGVQGTGVYNSVVGHGSGEDTTAQHRHVPRATDSESSPTSAGVGSLPIGAGVYNSVTGHGSNRQDDTHHNSGTIGTTTSASQADRNSGLDSSRFAAGQETKHPEEPKRGEHLAEAGAGVGAGAATYGLLHNRKENEREQHTPQTQTTAHQSKPDKTYDDSHDSKLAGIFHRSHDDKDTSSREHKHDKTHEPKTETKHHHEKPAAAAVLAGNSHDKTNDPSVRDYGTGPQHSSTSTQQQNTMPNSVYSSQPSQNAQSSHESRNIAGLAGLGAGAAASDYGTGPQHSSTLTQQQNTNSNPLNSTQPTQSTKSSHGSSNVAGLAGLGSGAAARDYGTGPQDTSTAGQQQNTTSSPFNSSQPSQDAQTSHGSRDVAGLLGLGAGGAAGYEASRLAKHDNDSAASQNLFTTRDTAHQIISSPTSTNSTQGAAGQSGISSTLAGATTSRDIGSQANPTNLDAGDHSKTLSSGTTSGVDSRSNNTADSYSHLPSGTATGIATQQTPRDSSVAGTQSKDPYQHLSTGTASGVQDVKHSDTRGAAAVGSHKVDNSSPRNSGGSGSYNHLSSGTPSGIDLGANHTQ